MQASILYVLPVACGYDVSQRVGEVVLDHFREAAGARCEVEEHDVVVFGPLVLWRGRENIGLRIDSLLVIDPSFLCAIDHDFEFKDVAGFRLCEIALMQQVAVIDADACFD